MKRIFGAEHYQGGRKKDYFEGWYFRHAGEYPFSVIAGVSRSDGAHSFIQYIDSERSGYYRFPLDTFSYTRDKMCVRIGDNEFSQAGLNFDVQDGNGRIGAHLVYDAPILYRKTLYAPSVMGPFSYLPMPCNHALVSLDHAYSGNLCADGVSRELNGHGYIEKDYGSAFPDNYVWLHAVQDGFSLMCAVAWPLIFGIRGFLCILSYGGRQYNLSLYTGAKLTAFSLSPDAVELEIRRGKQHITLSAHQNASARRLIAPARGGKMNLPILENLNADLRLHCDLNGQPLDLSALTVCALECVLADK